MKGKKKKCDYGIIIIEKKWCKMYFAELTSSGDVQEEIHSIEWSPEKYIEEDGVRLFEEVARKIKREYPNYLELNKILISMPGTIREHSVVCSSSRIGIRKEINAGDYLHKELNVPIEIVHDMDCMLMGAFKDMLYTNDTIDKTLCYVMVDEGIGSTFMIGGKIHHGAGIAGHISRLVVEKKGAFLQELSASGTLEAYVSRPGISKRCIERYVASLNKKKRKSKVTTEKFRRCLNAIYKNDPTGLTYDTINLGLEERDEIATTTIKEAAEYLGQAINAIITIMHPHEIVLSGNLISHIEDFYDQTISEAEELSWPAAWNSVNFRKSDDSRKDQLKGAIIFATNEDFEEVL